MTADQPTEPGTAAGRALLEAIFDIENGAFPSNPADAIAAIESEARATAPAGLDEGLAQALRRSILRRGDDHKATWTAVAGDGLTPDEVLASTLDAARPASVEDVRAVLAAWGMEANVTFSRDVYERGEEAVKRLRAALAASGETEQDR